MKIITLEEALCHDNSNLLIAKDVVLTSAIDIVIAKMDQYFKKVGITRYVVSGYRGPDHQLQLIINYAKQYNIPVDFTHDDYTKKESDGNYVWQDTWSKLLSLNFPKPGILINPPIESRCLYDYLNPNKGVVHAGTTISASMHQIGFAFDISGKNEKGIADLDSVIRVYQLAKTINPYLGIPSVTIERAQDCLHCNVSS